MAQMAAGVVKMSITLLMLVLFSVATGGKRAAAAGVHHVVGDDGGWAPSTDLVSWFSNRVFRVGDKIWFAYPAAEESVMEVQTAEEFYSCDLTNPIRMYTSGLDEVSLGGEGIRYFTSGSFESCKNGLKLPVKVQPQEKNETLKEASADGPKPSSSSHFTCLCFTVFVGLVVSYMGIIGLVA